MLPPSTQPIPRTSLEPVCGALAAVIQRRRERAGLSMNQLAARTRLSRPMIRFIETNERIPTIDTLARISRAFGVSCGQLIREAERTLD